LHYWKLTLQSANNLGFLAPLIFNIRRFDALLTRGLVVQARIADRSWVLIRR
jgi:hypothetical protein